MSHETETALIERFLKGDSGAFDALLKPIESDVRSFLRGQLRSRPEVDVEDVLQDVRIYLFQRLDRYNPEYPFAVFVRGLAKNIVKRHLYRKSDLAPSRWEDDKEEGWTEDLTPADLERAPLHLRQVLGEGRFEDPGAAPPASRLFLEVFEVFLRYGGYPHQQAAFGYSILLWGKAKHEKKGEGLLEGLKAGDKVPVTGDPDRVVREVGPRPLGPSCGDMLSGIQSEAKLDPAFLARARRPLDERLAMTGTQLFSKDRTSYLQFQAIEGRVTGENPLETYFGKDCRKSVADWTRGVKERIKKAFLDPASRARNPLPATETSREP